MEPYNFSNTLSKYNSPSPSEDLKKDTRTLSQRQSDFREKQNPSKYFLSNFGNNYSSTEDAKDPLNGLNLSEDEKTDAFSLFKDPSEQSGPTYGNLEKLKLGDYGEKKSLPKATPVSEIIPEGFTDSWGGLDSVDTEIDSIKNPKSEGWKGTGSTADSVLGVASFATQIGTALSTVNEGGDAGAISQGLSLVASGASAGMSVAGPLGAVVGGTVGAAVGVADYFSDNKKISKKIRNERDDRLDESARRRQRDYSSAKGKKRNDALMNYHQAQLGYINLEDY